MNILEQEDIIKGLPDQALQEEAKAPSGQVPQFLVVSEIQRRTDMRKKYQDPNEQKPQGTVADQITQEGIASVQPQQPMQGQQQQGQPMPMRGGGMTPFMAKYAGGGVVRMQEGGMTPQTLEQKYPFLSGSEDQILQGLNTVDPNDLEPIYSMFKSVPKIEQFIANRASNPAPPLSAVRPELFDAEMPQPPMSVENVTEPRLLTLDGVNTLTPDGQRPYPPNTPSVDMLDQFSNAITEDASRVKNILATLDDSTAEEKEAISNPVNVNLPKIRTLSEIGEQAPKSLTNKKPAFYQQKPDDSSILKRLLEDVGNSTSASMDRGATYLSPSIGTVSNAVGDAGSLVGEGASAVDSFMKKGILDVGEYVTGDLANSLTAGDFSSPYEAGRTISASATQPLSFLADKLGDGYQGAYNLTAGMLEPIENLGRGLVGAGERQGKGFRYDTPRGLFQQDDSGKSFYFGGSDSGGSNSSSASSSEPFGTGTVLRQPVGTNTVLRKDNGMYLPELANPDLLSNLERKEVTSVAENNNAVISDGAGTQGSGDPIEKGSNRAVSLLDRALGLNLDGAKKEAYAMAMIQLGAGIAKGDLAEGLSNAGVAASGVLDKARDRSGKQLDRDLQSQFYADKLESSSEENRQALTLKVETAYMNWLNEGGNLKTDAEKVTYKSDLYKAVFGEEAQGDDDQSGQRGKVATISYDKDGNRI